MNETLITFLAGGLYLCALCVTFWWIHRNMTERDAHMESRAFECPADDKGAQTALTVSRKSHCPEQRKSVSI